MAEKYLIVVDMQNDFVTGSLGTREAEEVLLKVIQKVKEFDGAIWFTQDTHEADYLETQEGRNLPVEHCIRDTQGWQLVDELACIQQERQLPIFLKNTFGSIRLAEELQKREREDGVESVELIGLCTDVCVVSNALILKAYLPETPIYVDAECCAGVTTESHLAAVNTMKSCQIIVKNI